MATFNNPLKSKGFFGSLASNVGGKVKSAQSAVAPFAPALGVAGQVAGVIGGILQGKEDKKAKEFQNQVMQEQKHQVGLRTIGQEFGARRGEFARDAQRVNVRPLSSLLESTSASFGG